MNNFTPTQIEILKILADGKRHHRDEIRKCLIDDMAGNSTIRMHVLNLRKKLQAKGEDVVCVIGSGGPKDLKYQHVRLLASPYDGKR